MHPFKYRTSRPVLLCEGGTGQEVTRTQLLKSPHREVRDAAARYRAFVFGGTRFMPVLESAETVYSGRARLTSLPGFPAVQAAPIEEIRAIADRSGRAFNLSSPGKTPTPDHIRKLDVVVVRAVEKRLVLRAWLPVAGAVLGLLATAVGGYFLIECAEQWAASPCDRRAEVCAP